MKQKLVYLILFLCTMLVSSKKSFLKFNKFFVNDKVNNLVETEPPKAVPASPTATTADPPKVIMGNCFVKSKGKFYDLYPMSLLNDKYFFNNPFLGVSFLKTALGL